MPEEATKWEDVFEHWVNFCVGIEALKKENPDFNTVVVPLCNAITGSDKVPTNEFTDDVSQGIEDAVSDYFCGDEEEEDEEETHG